LDTHHKSPWRIPAYLVGVFLLFTIVIVLVGYAYYAALKKQFREDKADAVIAVANLKASEIETWRRERLNDAAFIFRSVQIASEVHEITSRSERPFKVPDWMSSMYLNQQYASMRLLSPTGEALCTLPAERAEIPLSDEVMDIVRRAAVEKKVLLSSLNRQENWGTRMRLVVPLFLPRRGDSLLVGTVVIGIDPEKFLYPLMETWPTPSATAEVVLVAVERDSVVFLNRLRHQPESAVTLRMSIREADLPAAMAVRGLGGVVEGRDYRGVPVLAALRPIRSAEWHLVAKIDLDEVYAPLRERAWFVAFLAGALILSTAFTIFGLWRNQSARLFKKQYEAEVSRKALAAHYNYLTKYANDVILLMDDKGNILDANERAEDLYGYEREELLHLNLRELTTASDTRLESTSNDSENATGTIFESAHRKKDRSIFPVEVSARAIEVDGMWFHQGIIRDITQRKQHELQIARLNRIYAVLSEVNQTIVRMRDKETLFREVCSILVKRGSMRLAWIGTLDEATHNVVVRAFDGVEDGYLTGIRLSIEDNEYGRGPVGVALRSRQPAIFNHIATDPGFRPWREAALKRGYQSAAAFPLLHDSESVGVLVLYAPEVGFFDAEEVVLLGEIATDISFAIRTIEQENQRQWAETDLRNTEARFRAMFENAGIGIVLADEKGSPTESNLAYQVILGYTNQELRGMELSDLVHPDDREEERKLFHELISGKRLVYQLDKRYVRKDGRIIWGSVTVSVVRNDDGKALYVIGMLRDTTDRRRAVELLARTEERFSKVFHASPIAIGIGRLSDGRFIDVNESFTRLIGLSREEAIGRTGVELDMWADTETRTQMMNKLKAERSVQSEEIVLKTKTNEHLNIRASFEIVDISGEPCMLGLLEDISERKRAEKELRNTEEKYRNMFDSASEGIYQSTLDGKFVMVNSTFARILGYRDPEDLMTRITSIEEQLYGNPEDRAKLKDRLATEGFVQGFETELVCGDGTKIWVSENARCVRDEKGLVRHFEGFVQDITGRKRAEEELRAREFWLRESQRVGHVGSYDLDIRSGQWASSEILDEIFGIERDAEKSVATWNAIVHPDQREEMLQYFLQDVVAARRPFNKEYKIARPKDGAVRWLWGRGELTYDEAGSPVRMIGVIQDITERRRAEEQLQRSLIDYRNLFESANDAIIIFEPVDEIIMEANGKACEVYGFSRHELVGKSLKAITKDVARGEQQIQELLREGDFHNFETIHIRKDGTPIDMLVSASVIEYTGRKAIQCINRDITDWKRAQEKLRQLSSAVEQSPVSIIITDPKGVIEYVNQRFTQVTGYTYAETIGKNPRILKSGNQTPEEYARLWATITAGKEWRGEFLNKKKDGELYWEFASLSAIKNESGAITHFLAVKEDITERKSLEQQFRQAQKLEGIGTLAGGIAHDFNNILGIILGHSTLLRRVGDDPQRTEKSIGSIESAVQRGAGLVRQILTFARKTDVRFEQLNVNETISELQKMLEETFPKTTVLSVHFDQPLCIIEADRTQLHQTLLNLCVNARDAMPDGGTITIQTSQIPGEQLRRRFMQATKAFYACITVSDSGTGMDEATRQRVFEPFFTTKEKGKGTGLGLAVVFGIMQGHHGFIDLESEVGMGTTFRLYFPLPTASIQPSNGEAGVLDAVAGGNETILLVEDEEMLRELARTLLETHGYKVIVASDGNEAVQRYEESRDSIDLVVSDIGLPRLSGDAVFRKLKATNPQVSIILASGYIEPGVRTALLREGVHEIVQKPYEPTDLLRKIRETIDRQAQK